MRGNSFFYFFFRRNKVAWLKSTFNSDMKTVSGLICRHRASRVFLLRVKISWAGGRLCLRALGTAQYQAGWHTSANKLQRTAGGGGGGVRGKGAGKFVFPMMQSGILGSRQAALFFLWFPRGPTQTGSQGSLFLHFDGLGCPAGAD